MADMTKYPEGPQEIIQYMDWLPDDDEVRMTWLNIFALVAVGC